MFGFLVNGKVRQLTIHLKAATATTIKMGCIKKSKSKGNASLLILLAFGFFLKDCRAAQTFEKQPDYNEVNPGQESIVTCKIFNKKGQCSWQKDGKPVGIYLGKYEWAGNPDTGDCSLRVMNAALEYDDGEWECQVTASDFQAQDALTSRPVKLVVRVPPNAPQIEYNGTQIPTGKNVTAAHGARVAVKCSSRYGNPPALLKWFVGEEEITGVNQTNKTEDDNAKKWAALSILEYTFTKQQNGKIIKCVAVHEAYPTKSRDTQTILDIQYGPQIKLLGQPEGDLEENKDEVTLRCIADANPPATIVWRKAGRPDIFSFQETISLKPLLRRHSGSFSCEAKNEIGKSQPITVDIDVKYPPKITRAGPERVVVAALYNRTVLVCQADGNPQPAYQWLQKTTTAEETVYVRGAEQMLVIHNVTYDYQGRYVCKASNIISGTERHSQSEPIDLSVMGPPQVLRHAVEKEVAVERGSDAALAVTFCSNPGPTKAIWEWGSMKLESGYEMGRFTAEKIEKGPRTDCYEARLRVSRTDSADSRNYYLNIENSKGNDRYSVVLQVRGFDFITFADPVSMATVIGVIIGCLILLVVVSMFIVYAFKAEKWCFSKSDFKPTDLESEKSDLEGSDRSSSHVHHPNGKTTGFATIPTSEMQFSHPQKRSSRPPDPILPQDIQIMKVHADKPNGRDVEVNNGRRRSSANSTKSGISNHQLSPQNIPPHQPQQHRPHHPHARSKDISKQNIIANQKQVVPKKSGGKLDKEENVVQYYPPYNVHNPNVSVRLSDSPETFGWAYGHGGNSCDANHCSSCIINATSQGHNNGGQVYNNAGTNSLNR
ncbi:kin of IRRE-like protein 3 isoform X3 [Folsomia candida]|uniref:kin of IRRE-like protein 3 isoform X3 n=1 Tax=Folsomia candida TaxID=158441 RepID=UPI000B8FD1C9|nr:kin of IRRE-like protein 3 isoform X3 [Folsomia candida]